MNNNGNFYPGVQVPTSGCGTSNLPGVAVYQPSVECPGAGFGASTFASPATPLQIGLTNPIAKFRFASSAADRSVLFGNVTSRCATLIGTELGVTILQVCDDGVATLNREANQLCCLWDSNQETIIGLIGKSSSDFDSLGGSQVLFSACNPCFTSDIEFVCSNGCNDNSNFILTNAVAGGPAALVVTIPAGVAITFDVCSCAPQVNSFASCATSYPTVANIAAAPACPPAGNAGFIAGRGF